MNITNNQRSFVSWNSTCLLTLGSYFMNSNFWGNFLGFFLATLHGNIMLCHGSQSLVQVVSQPRTRNILFLRYSEVLLGLLRPVSLPFVRIGLFSCRNDNEVSNCRGDLDSECVLVYSSSLIMFKYA